MRSMVVGTETRSTTGGEGRVGRPFLHAPQGARPGDRRGQEARVPSSPRGEGAGDAEDRAEAVVTSARAVPSPSGEDPVEVLRAGTAFVDLSFWRKIEVRGSDAFGWLNDLVSADL